MFVPSLAHENPGRQSAWLVHVCRQRPFGLELSFGEIAPEHTLPDGQSLAPSTQNSEQYPPGQP